MAKLDQSRRYPHSKTDKSKSPVKVAAKPVRKTGQAEIDKNLRKLERGRAGIRRAPARGPALGTTDESRFSAKKSGKMMIPDDLSNKQKLKAIWVNEGVDACLAVAKKLGFTRIEVMERITKWMRKEEREMK